LVPRRKLSVPRTGPFARYSRFVGLMKVLLPSLAAVLLGLVVVWPRLMLEDKRFQLGFAKLPSKEVETLAMQNPRYYGLDDSNRPFTVTADWARQEPGSSDLITLEAPKADFMSNSGANVVLDATQGLYRQPQKLLDLSGGVNLYHDAGYEIHTPTAVIDLAKGSARGIDPVTGHGPQGAIEAEGFEIAGKGKLITFAGKSHLSLRAASPKGSDKKGKRR
jgi:lipopolysaccharide export system protein LptC